MGLRLSVFYRYFPQPDMTEFAPTYGTLHTHPAHTQVSGLRWPRAGCALFLRQLDLWLWFQETPFPRNLLKVLCFRELAPGSQIRQRRKEKGQKASATRAQRSSGPGPGREGGRTRRAGTAEAEAEAEAGGVSSRRHARGAALSRGLQARLLWALCP